MRRDVAREELVDREPGDHDDGRASDERPAASAADHHRENRDTHDHGEHRTTAGGEREADDEHGQTDHKTPEASNGDQQQDRARDQLAHRVLVELARQPMRVQYRPGHREQRGQRSRTPAEGRSDRREARETRRRTAAATTARGAARSCRPNQAPGATRAGRSPASRTGRTRSERAQSPQNADSSGGYGSVCQKARADQHEHDVASGYMQAQMTPGDVLNLRNRCAEQDSGQPARYEHHERHREPDGHEDEEETGYRRVGDGGGRCDDDRRAGHEHGKLGTDRSLSDAARPAVWRDLSSQPVTSSTVLRADDGPIAQRHMASPGRTGSAGANGDGGGCASAGSRDGGGDAGAATDGAASAARGA